MKYELFDYQRVELQYLKDEKGKGSRLFMEAGTGKSAVVLKLIEDLHMSMQCGSAIIYIPPSLALNWELEIKKWMPDLPVSVYPITGTESAKKRASYLAEGRLHSDQYGGLSIYLVSYSLAFTSVKALKKLKAEVIVADESHLVKNKDTKVFRGVRDVIRDAEYRIVMTGTPDPQGKADYWAQYHLTSPEIFGSWIEFRSRFCRTGFFGANQIVGYKNVKELNSLIAGTSHFLELSTVVELLPLRMTEVAFSLGSDAEDYQHLEEETAIRFSDAQYDRAQLKKLLRENGVHFDPRTSYTELLWLASDNLVLDTASADFAMTMTSKLHQLVGGTIKLDTGVPYINENATKPHQLYQLLEGFHKDDVTLIFHYYTAEEQVIRQVCEKLGHSVIVYNKEDNSLKDFLEGKGDILIIQIMRGGVGLNLQRANKIIFYSYFYRSSDYTQAVRRAYRVGQTRPVDVYTMIAQGTIEEDVWERVQRKRKRTGRMFKRGK